MLSNHSKTLLGIQTSNNFKAGWSSGAEKICPIIIHSAKWINCKHHQKVLAKQKQCDKSTTTIAITKRTPAIDSRRRNDPGASVLAPARSQEECAHRNPRSGVGSLKGLVESATDTTRWPTSERRRGLRGLRGFPHRSDDQIQSEREE